MWVKEQSSIVMIYPAHAGINRMTVPVVRETLYLPRTRGDKPYAARSLAASQVSTPHTRG